MRNWKAVSLDKSTILILCILEGHQLHLSCIAISDFMIGLKFFSHYLLLLEQTFGLETFPMFVFVCSSFRMVL